MRDLGQRLIKKKVNEELAEIADSIAITMKTYGNRGVSLYNLANYLESSLEVKNSETLRENKKYLCLCVTNAMRVLEDNKLVAFGNDGLYRLTDEGKRLL